MKISHQDSTGINYWVASPDTGQAMATDFELSLEGQSYVTLRFSLVEPIDNILSYI